MIAAFSMKILLAEGNKSTRTTYLMTIKQVIPEAEIHEVAGSSAMQTMALCRNYNLVIANETLPKRIPTAKIIRAIREYGKKIPIWIYGYDNIGEKNFQAGANNYYSRNKLEDIARFVSDLKNLSQSGS